MKAGPHESRRTEAGQSAGPMKDKLASCPWRGRREMMMNPCIQHKESSSAQGLMRRTTRASLPLLGALAPVQKSTAHHTQPLQRQVFQLVVAIEMYLDMSAAKCRLFSYGTTAAGYARIQALLTTGRSVRCSSEHRFSRQSHPSGSADRL